MTKTWENLIKKRQKAQKILTKTSKKVTKVLKKMTKTLEFFFFLHFDPEKPKSCIMVEGETTQGLTVGIYSTPMHHPVRTTTVATPPKISKKRLSVFGF